MKIGILTWYFGINYGARAHSYALMKVLEKMGHSVVFVNYRSTSNWKEELMTACQIEHRHKHPISTLRGVSRYFAFCKQLKEYPQTSKMIDLTNLDKENIELLILGSDEIINLNHSLYSEYYFGVNIPNSIPIITYAVSAGTVSPNFILPDTIKKSLSRLKAISVRDTTSYELIFYNTDRKAIEVLDPTFLYDFNGLESKWMDKDYILIYSFGFLKEYSQTIRRFAKSKGLKIYVVGHVSEWADKSFMSADLHMWLALYKNASYVITDSYHGFIFALKYEKEYILLKRGDKANKVDGLINYLHINRKYYTPTQALEEYLAEHIDYPQINETISTLKKKSIDYLTTEINQIRGEKI